jgi:peptide/nickel transport system substrate-binding protein
VGRRCRPGIAKAAKATDANTVVVDFKMPSPRFFFFMTYKYDIGVYIVPKHIFEGQDWTSFKHFDIAKGWPVTTGPWKVTDASLQQKVFDRRPDWWAAEETGPACRWCCATSGCPRSASRAWRRRSSPTRWTAGPACSRPRSRRYSGRTPKSPPMPGKSRLTAMSIGGRSRCIVNNEVKPFDDKDVRWAMSHYVDRQQLIDVGYLGACQPSRCRCRTTSRCGPISTAVKDLLAKYDTLEFNPKKGDALLSGKGYKKDSDGIWADGRRTAQRWISSASAPPVRRWARAVRDAEAARYRRRMAAAARFRRPLPERPVHVGSIYGHGGSDQRTVRDVATVPEDAAWPCPAPIW